MQNNQQTYDETRILQATRIRLFRSLQQDNVSIEGIKDCLESIEKCDALIAGLKEQA